MFHEDGIEVYLRPIGTKDESTKNIELPLLNSDRASVHDDRYSQCATIVQRAGFEVVIKVAASFDMFSASHCKQRFHMRSEVDGEIVRKKLPRAWVFWNGHNRGGEFICQIPGSDYEAALDSVRKSRPVFDVQIVRCKTSSTGITKRRRTTIGPFDSRQASRPRRTIELPRRPSIELPGQPGRPYCFAFTLIASTAASGISSKPGPSGCPILLANESSQIPSMVVSKKHQASKSRTAAPVFCDCPDPAHNRRSKTKAAPNLEGSKAASAKSKQKRAEVSTEDDNDDEGMASQDTETTPKGKDDIDKVKACSKCKKPKVPRKKREAYLADWRRQNAKGDEDDDEEIPVDKTEASGADPVPGNGKPTKAVHEPAQVEATHSIEDAAILNADGSTALGGELQNQLSAMTTPSISTADPAVGNDSTSQQTRQDESMSPKTTGGRMLTPTSSPKLPSVAGDNATKKRAADQSPERRSCKVQRIDIDLTADDDDELAVVKVEHGSAGDFHRTPMARRSTQNEQSIRDRLTIVNMQLEEARLRREQAELQQQLKAFRYQQRESVQIKSEQIIKIEE